MHKIAQKTHRKKRAEKWSQNACKIRNLFKKLPQARKIFKMAQKVI
jgi:hypothetical protein